VVTVCIAHITAQAGFINPKKIKEFEVGEELKAVLKALGQQIGLESLPLALHMGSCVDNSRIGVFILTGVKGAEDPSLAEGDGPLEAFKWWCFRGG